jgi:hypothetical protein
VVVELLDADALGLGGRRARAQRLIEGFPAVLPVMHGLVGDAERRRRRCLCAAR